RMVKARRQGEAAVDRNEPEARLEAEDAAAGGRNPDRPGGIGAERRVGQAGGEGRSGTAARAARGPAWRARVRHGAVVRVLRRDPVGELVQVGLADVDITGRL